MQLFKLVGLVFIEHCTVCNTIDGSHSHTVWPMYILMLLSFFRFFLRESEQAVNTLSSAEASYFFVWAGNWGEVKSKRAEPGENRNESARGTLGREKERREASAR